MDAKVPDWLLPRPLLDLTPEKQRSFEDLWKLSKVNKEVEYCLPYPKWQFLTYLCDTKALVLHGSQNHEIGVVEPRQASDIRAYSNQRAIYATTDGIWVMYFAILDRLRFPNVSLFNSCLQARIGPGQLSDPLYFFSITHSVLVQNPWVEGMVYILPRSSFDREPAQQMQGMEIHFPHWISRKAVKSASRLVVGPEDFPFLTQVHGHYNEKLGQLASADPNGYPWPEALVS